MENKNLCIFYASSLTQFRELVEFAKISKLKEGLKPVFWLAVSDPIASLPPWCIDAINQLSKLNIEYTAIYNNIECKSNNTVIYSNIVIYRFEYLIRKIIKLCWFKTLTNTYKYALKLFSKQNITSFIIGEDGVGGPLPYIKAAKQLGIKVIIIPYEFSMPDQAIMAIESSPSINQFKINSFPKLLTKFLFPHWSFKKVGQGSEEYLRLPLHMIWSIIIAGMDIKNPWLVHGGSADILLSESEAMYEIYLKLGVPKEKIIYTNSPRYINLARYILSDKLILEAFKTNRYITLNKPKLLIALPPSYFENEKLKHMFEEYDQLLEFLAEMAEKVRLKSITLQLHPGVQPSVRKTINKFIERNAIFKLSKDDLDRLIVSHDIFMTCASSTIRWAIAAKKPVINIDIFGFDFPDYDGVNGVLKSDNTDDIIKHLEKLISSETFYSQYIKSSDFRKWGIFKNTKMTLEELKKINKNFEDKIISLLS
jgi:hypothetical protein